MSAAAATIQTAPTDIQERLSLAYLMAVAAHAGCDVLHPNVDRNGIDALIKPISGAPVQIDVQMKSTIQNLRINGGDIISYQLEADRYSKLIRTDAVMPQLFVVYEMPRTQQDWLRVTAHQSKLRHRAYWADLRGMPPAIGGSAAVHVPVTQPFDAAAIQAIMNKAHQLSLAGQTWR
jgi:hypothetical protein